MCVIDYMHTIYVSNRPVGFTLDLEMIIAKISFHVSGTDIMCIVS